MKRYASHLLASIHSCCLFHVHCFAHCRLCLAVYRIAIPGDFVPQVGDYVACPGTERRHDMQDGLPWPRSQHVWLTSLLNNGKTVFQFPGAAFRPSRIGIVRVLSEGFMRYAFTRGLELRTEFRDIRSRVPALTSLLVCVLSDCFRSVCPLCHTGRSSPSRDTLLIHVLTHVVVVCRQAADSYHVPWEWGKRRAPDTTR